MYLIVGLGNPEDRYRNTRHNLGFDFIDKLIEMVDFPGGSVDLKKSDQFLAAIDQLNIDGEKAIIAKPMTYMNKSGEAISKLMKFYKIDSNKIIIACDDCNLDVGMIRVRFGGVDGGHNGLKSIISAIGDEFWRVRIGVGTPNSFVPLEDYVLAKIPKDEKEILQDAVDKSVDFVINSISTNSFENKTI